MTYNHELDMERLYEMYSSGLHSVKHTHNIGHIEVVGHNVPETIPIKPPLPTPPAPIPPTPEPPSDHHHHKHKHKDSPWDTFVEGLEEGGQVLDDVFMGHEANGAGGLHTDTGK